jgi:hypothetical protein
MYECSKSSPVIDAWPELTSDQRSAVLALVRSFLVTDNVNHAVGEERRPVGRGAPQHPASEAANPNPRKGGGKIFAARVPQAVFPVERSPASISRATTSNQQEEMPCKR